MSALEPDDFVEIQLAGHDELRRPVFTLSMVCDGDRMVVWTGHSHAEAREAARVWDVEDVEVVDLVATGALH